MESVGEAGEETEGDEVGDDEGGEEREGGVRPEGVGGEAGAEGGSEHRRSCGGERFLRVWGRVKTGGF